MKSVTLFHVVGKEVMVSEGADYIYTHVEWLVVLVVFVGMIL